METFGQRLRRRAQDLGLSDAEAARRAGLSERRYGNYVTGTREPDFGTLARICSALATTPNALLGFETGSSAATGRDCLRDLLLSAVERMQEDDLALSVKFAEMLVTHRRAQR